MSASACTRLRLVYYWNIRLPIRYTLTVISARYRIAFGETEQNGILANKNAISGPGGLLHPPAAEKRSKKRFTAGDRPFTPSSRRVLVN